MGSKYVPGILFQVQKYCNDNNRKIMNETEYSINNRTENSIVQYIYIQGGIAIRSMSTGGLPIPTSKFVPSLG
jgi:hypothetical protein